MRFSPRERAPAVSMSHSVHERFFALGSLPSPLPNYDPPMLLPSAYPSSEPPGHPRASASALEM